MRQPRDFVPDRCYHLISRIANRAFYLGEDERTRFVARMWRVAYFSCVEVLAYCVMSNHFHILAYIPAPRDLSEEEVLARARTLYFGEKLVEFEREWAVVVRCGDAERRRHFLARFTRRMWNASEFMKTLKQSSSQSFNARRLHAGTMWESRFRARVIMPDAKAELMKAAGYIDRNPVKAGLAKWPDRYRWCGFAAACAGDVRCQEGYRFIYTFAPVEWPRAKALHETSIGLAVKELEEDAEAKEAIGSHGGNRLSVSAERLEAMKRRRWGEMEDALPDMIPRVLDRGSRRIARDVLAILADGPRRPSEIRGMLGIASANYFTARYITPMKESGLIAPVNAASLHSPWQAYRLTPKGRKMLS